MIPDAKVSGSGDKDKMGVDVVLSDQETFKFKVFDLNEKKNKLSYIVVGDHFMFSTYKCTISLLVNLKIKCSKKKKRKLKINKQV